MNTESFCFEWPDFAWLGHQQSWIGFKNNIAGVISRNDLDYVQIVQQSCTQETLQQGDQIQIIIIVHYKQRSYIQHLIK